MRVLEGRMSSSGRFQNYICINLFRWLKLLSHCGPDDPEIDLGLFSWASKIYPCGKWVLHYDEHCFERRWEAVFGAWNRRKLSQWWPNVFGLPGIHSQGKCFHVPSLSYQKPRLLSFLTASKLLLLIKSRIFKLFIFIEATKNLK